MPVPGSSTGRVSTQTRSLIGKDRREGYKENNRGLVLSRGGGRDGIRPLQSLCPPIGPCRMCFLSTPSLVFSRYPLWGA